MSWFELGFFCHLVSVLKSTPAFSGVFGNYLFFSATGLIRRSRSFSLIHLGVPFPSRFSSFPAFSLLFLQHSATAGIHRRSALLCSIILFFAALSGYFERFRKASASAFADFIILLLCLLFLFSFVFLNLI